jgi:hypothetical protein
MTWDTFDKLSQQLTSIEVDSREMLSKIISLVFDKAVDEPNFGELYAELCVQVRVGGPRHTHTHTPTHTHTCAWTWPLDACDQALQ